MFWELFEKYYDDLKNKNFSSPIYEYFLNSRNKEYLKKTKDKRKVVDFISGMTDNFFNKQYEELFTPKNFGYSI
jgi:dGTPase